jgi:hypothetical protein
MLAWITTSAPTLAGQPLLPQHWVQEAQASGWHVRLAGPRNFVLWRNRLSPDTAPRILVLPHRDCGLSPMEFGAVFADLAHRADLPHVSHGIEGEAWQYWLDQAERRLFERIAPTAVRSC